MGFVGAGGDAFNFGGGHEVGSAKCRGADEDFSGFGGHQGCGENGVGSRTERDQAVILKEDEARSGVVFFDEGFGAIANFAREGEAGIDVGNENAFRAATNNLIGKVAAFGEIAGARRTENLIYGDGMRVTDEFDAGQRQEPRVKDRFDARLFRFCIETRVKERLINRGVVDFLCVEKRKNFRKIAPGQISGGEGGEIKTAGFDRERTRVKARGSIAFAEDGEILFGRAEIVGQLEERAQFCFCVH